MAVQISGNDITVPRDGVFSRNVSIAGTLTYEDVTNVDSIGLVTARNGIEVGASPGVAASISVDGNAIFSGITTIGGNVKVGTGITISPDGDIFFTGIITGNGSGLTNAGPTLTNGSNDRIVTATGANALNGEANLQFDGTDLYVSDKIKHLGDPDTLIEFATDTITLDTAGTERLRIDSSGNVTKPTNFHLLVNLSQNYTVQNASTVTTDLVKWDRVITAQSSSGASSYFNTSTHLFTAPVDGIYLFHISVNCDFNVEEAWLVIDGSRANYSAVGPRSSTQSSISLTYKLTASQTVGVKWYQNGNTNADFFSDDLHTWWKIDLLG